jgi:hypothetical protein
MKTDAELLAHAVALGFGGTCLHWRPRGPERIAKLTTAIAVGPFMGDTYTMRFPRRRARGEKAEIRQWLAQQLQTAAARSGMARA